MKTGKIITIISIVILSGCEDIFFEKEASDTPVNNFEMFWNDFNKFYPSFDIKQINWDSTYLANRPKISEQTTDIELFKILSGMITPLKDGHVTLMTNVGKCYSKTVPENYYSNMRISPQSYLSSFETTNSNISFWSVKNTSIGYISINTFNVKGGTFVSSDDSFLIIDEILTQFKEKSGIIIDLRWNSGGLPANVETIANRFTDSKKLYLKIRSKIGPGKNDFSGWTDCFIEPKGSARFLKPVVVLTSKNTGSAAEWFALAMKALQNTSIVGDTTAGCFSPKIERELPNGWSFSLSAKVVVSASMVQYEGFGIPPDYTVINSSNELANKRDAMLEKAIEIIQTKNSK